MSEPGFVYVLMNPSMPGLLKIGRTNRSTDERLRELNVTAVPTPFVLAYESFFDDSALAEEFVHAYLESKGHRVSRQREFFDAPLNLVVDAILAARSRFPHGQRGAPPTVDSPEPNRDSGYSMTKGHEPWAQILRQADNYRFGWQGEIRDERRAYRVYEQAARLGAPEAFLALAYMCQNGIGSNKNREQAIGWLRKGASLGVRWCWSELADIYLKSNPRELDNGRKCLRRFFDRSEISALNDEQEREFFFRLRSYGDLCNPASPDFSEDSAVFEHAATELLEKIASIGAATERDARAEAVRRLMRRGATR
jgi:hypothetical protein